MSSEVKPEPTMFDEIDSQPQVGSHTQGENAAPKTATAPLPKEEEVAAVAASPSIVKVIGELEPPSFIEPKADLICGATGSGKTTNIGEVSDYILKKYGKLTRMVGADPGGYGPLKGMVDSGQIEYMPLFAWKNQVDAMYKVCHGYWPLRVNDPESPLVEPDAGTYAMYGFMAYEGLTSFGDAILNSLGDDQAKLSQSPSYIYKQGDTEFAGGNESYYGFMQKELNRFVMYTNLLKFEKVLWTALESKVKDGDNWVYGPMIGGKKAGGKAGAWFCNFVHIDILAGETVKDIKTGQSLVKARHVLFLKTHIDLITLTPFPCKIRPPKKYAAEVPDYLESGSLADAYGLLDNLYDRQAKDSESKMSEITGLKERLMESAIKAKKAEAEAAERRAKAAKLLKPMVSVPAAGVVNTTTVPVTNGTKGASQPTAGPKMPAKPVGSVTIQPAGKVK